MLSFNQAVRSTQTLELPLTNHGTLLISSDVRRKKILSWIKAIVFIVLATIYTIA